MWAAKHIVQCCFHQPQPSLRKYYSSNSKSPKKGSHSLEIYRFYLVPGRRMLLQHSQHISLTLSRISASRLTSGCSSLLLIHLLIIHCPRCAVIWLTLTTSCRGTTRRWCSRGSWVLALLVTRWTLLQESVPFVMSQMQSQTICFLSIISSISTKITSS